MLDSDQQPLVQDRHHPSDHKNNNQFVHRAPMNHIHDGRKSPFRMIQLSHSRLISSSLHSLLIIFLFARRRARSMTPIRAPLHLNPDREQLLLALADSEADVAHITKQISLVKDILTKLKFVRTSS